MKVIELENNNIKLVADENKIIQSKATHFDEELNTEVPDVEGTIVYLGKNDNAENYIEEEVEYGSSKI